MFCTKKTYVSAIVLTAAGLVYLSLLSTHNATPVSSFGLAEQTVIHTTEKIPCKVPLTPQIVTKGVPESVRIGEDFEITFHRILSTSGNCSMDGVKAPDVFLANIQIVNDLTGLPDVVADASVVFVKIVADPSSRRYAAEYKIRSRVYDVGEHTMKLIQSHFFTNDTDLMQLDTHRSPEESFESVRFVQGYSPFAFGTNNLGGVWCKMWTLKAMIDTNNQSSIKRHDGSLEECSKLEDGFTGRWRRKGLADDKRAAFEWVPYNCQLSRNYSCFQDKKLVMVGASIMRHAFQELRLLLEGKDSLQQAPLVLTTMRSNGDKIMVSPLLRRGTNISYFLCLNWCGPWHGIEEFVNPDIVIGTCGSHIWHTSVPQWKSVLVSLHKEMSGSTPWPGKNVSWIWMTSNPFNPDNERKSWKHKILQALPRFEAIRNDQKAVIGNHPIIDWFAMAKPIMMFSADQVHFNRWTYSELAKLMAHSVCMIERQRDMGNVVGKPEKTITEM